MTKYDIEKNFKLYLLNIAANEDFSVNTLNKLINKAKKAKRLLKKTARQSNLDPYIELKKTIKSSMPSEEKYNLVFSKNIYQKLLKKYPTFNFDDPDTTYANVVDSLYQQIKNHIKNL